MVLTLRSKMIILGSLGLDFLSNGNGCFDNFLGIGSDRLFFGDFESEKVHENMIGADALLHLFFTFILGGGWRGCFLSSEEGPDPVHGAHAEGGEDDEHE